MKTMYLERQTIVEALTKFGYKTHPNGIVASLDAEDDGDRVALKMHAAAVRKDGLMPDYPIVLTYRWNKDKIRPYLEPLSIREMTQEESAAHPQYFPRGDQAKDEPWRK